MRRSESKRCSEDQGRCTLQPLEPRALLAAVFNGTDVDGDAYTITLKGPGDMVVTTSQGGVTGFIDFIQFSGTEPGSTLSISVKAQGGDGRVALQGISGASALKSISAPKADLVDGGISLPMVGLLVLGDVAGGTVIQIGGADGDLVNITTRDLGGGTTATLNVQSRVGTLRTTGTNNFFAAVLARGVNVMRFSSGTNVFPIITQGAGFATAIGSIVGAGVVSINGQVTGRIGKVTATHVILSGVFGAIDSLRSTRGEVSGEDDGVLADTIGTIKAKSEFSGAWTADRIGTLTAGAEVRDAIIKLRTPDAAGRVLTSLKAPLVQDTSIGVEFAGTPGQIGAINVGAWQGGQILQGSIGTLRVRGDCSAQIDLTPGAGAPVSVNAATIGGVLTGEWVVPNRINAITARQAGTDGQNPFELDNADGLPLDVVRIRLSGAAAQFVTIDARSLGDVSSTGALTLIATLFGTLDGSGLGLRSLTSRQRLTATVTCEAVGVGLVKAGEVFESAFRTRFINDVNVARTLTDCLLRAVDSGPDGFGVQRVRIKGDASDLRLRSLGPVGTVDVLRLLDESIIYSGTTGGGGVPDDLGGFDAGGRIDLVRIRQKFTLDQSPAALATSSIVAPTIGNIVVSGRTDPVGPGELFGIGCRTLTGTIKVKDGANALVTIASPLGPGDVPPFAGSGDFIVRFYA